MYRGSPWALVFVLSFVTFNVSIWYSSTVYGQIGTATANRLGLEIAWNSQVQMPIAPTPIVSIHLWPSAEGARQYAETIVKGRLIRIFADQTGADGKPMGLDAAKDEAKVRAARVLGTFNGVEVNEGSIPRIYLVVITADGVVQTFDAETGVSLWRSPSGNGRAPVAPGSVGDLGVAVTNGGQLCMFEWRTGKLIKNIRLRNATSAGVALAGPISFVSTLAGVVAAYSVGQEKFHPWQYTGHGKPLHPPILGRAMIVPTATAAGNDAAAEPQETALAAMLTDKGYLYVFATTDNKPAAWFRFVSESPLTSWISSSKTGFYAGDVNGNVFKVMASRRGEISWRFSMGSPIICDPFVVSDKVFVVNQSRNLFALQETDGSVKWDSALAGIDAILASSQTRVYARGTGGKLIVVDTNNGQAKGQSDTSLINSFAVNQLNDRLYLISPTGQLQCLREIGALQPTMHISLPSADASKQLPAGDAPSQQANDSQLTEPAAPADPFGTTEPTTEAPAEPGNNPFSDTAVPAAADAPTTEPPAGANPFSTDAQPF